MPTVSTDMHTKRGIRSYREAPSEKDPDGAARLSGNEESRGRRLCALAEDTFVYEYYGEREAAMAKVTGLGGAFLRVDDPKALYAWYERHLGINSSAGCFTFTADVQRAQIAVAFFPRSSDYFPVSQPAMLNFQVDDLDGVLERLSAAGASVDSKREEYEYGRFGWFTDPQGNRVELWEPSA